MYTIPIDVLKRNCNKTMYEKGMRGYKGDFVENTVTATLDDGFLQIAGKVFFDNLKKEKMFVQLEYDQETREIVYSDCSCQTFQEHSGLCDHCVALAMQYNRMAAEKLFPFIQEQSGRETSPALQKLIFANSQRVLSRYQELSRQVLPAPVQLMPLLHYSLLDGHWSVSFRIGTSVQFYVLRDVSQFVQDMEQEAFVSYGKKLEFLHIRSAFAPDSLPLVDFITEYIGMEHYFRQKISNYYYSTGSSKREIPLTNANLFRLLQLVPEQKIDVDMTSGTPQPYQIRKQNSVMLPIQLMDEEDGLQLVLPQMQLLSDGSQHCLVLPRKFIFCSAEYAASVREFCDLANVRQEETYYIAERDVKAFCYKLLPALVKCSGINVGRLEEYLTESCKFRVYLDDDGMQILCKTEACYGEHKFLLTDKVPDNIMRNAEQEYEMRFLLEKYFPAWNSCGELYFSCRDEERLYQLLTEGVNEISQEAELYLSEQMERIQVQQQPKLRIGVRIDGDLLNLNIDAERLTQWEIQELLRNYRQRRKYYRMGNGNFLQLDSGSLATLAELAEGLNLTEEDLRQGRVRVPVYKAYYVDQILRESDETLTVQRELDFRILMRNLKNYEDSDDEVPAGLQTTLRHYQEVGYRWLMTMSCMSFGGILADDMGLGKTVQIIALLLANREKLREVPALIVAPASLVYNWESEIRRFAPTLHVCSLSVSVAERQKLMEKKDIDVFLVSYELLKRDAEQYRERSFSFFVIDEAQNIKNHHTKVSKAVKSIAASCRFALTGTPIENQLSELWSIFDFIMPGLLGKYEEFRERYEVPIVQKRDDVALEQLKKIVQPFMLRRLKQDVLKELPEKVETIVYSKMEPAQREIYIANLQNVLDNLKSKKNVGKQNERLEVLAELIRLRQLCCDPALLYEDYQGGSAKMETCLELIRNVIQGGSKVLVFSQFTAFLNRIKEQLNQMEIESYLLVGTTPQNKRSELVQRFNETDEAKVFLISLKAGGTGLNLTAANVVIHVDPWWNAAAQNQATDRAYRMGQKKAVTVFKLITKDTLEEKIYELQMQKAALSTSIMGVDGMMPPNLSREELLEILQISE